MTFSQQDLDELLRARQLLEKPGIAVRLTEALGYPIERSLTMLPERWQGVVQKAVHTAISQALRVAVSTLDEQKGAAPADRWHRGMAALSGAVGGIAGLPALVVELPVSTTIMLRSIADIARSQGEDVRSPEGRLACLEVFAFGGKPGDAQSAETGYYAVRAMLARSVSEATRYMAQRGAVEEGAPALVRLVAAIAARFQVVVSEKAVAQAIPLVGAAAGAAINTVFIDHFQDMARGHFTVRRLERTYGPAEVRAVYDRLEAVQNR